MEKTYLVVQFQQEVISMSWKFITGIAGYGISPKVCLGGDGYHPLNKQKIAQDNVNSCTFGPWEEHAMWESTDNQRS